MKRGSVGRPPGPHEETLHRLLPTALRLFLEEGGAALTPTRLHRETGLSRATIYRNWPEPADLIEVMLQKATRPPELPPSTGDLADDLHAAMAALLDRFNARPARAFFAACLEYGRCSDRVATAAEAFIAGILEPLRAVLDDAVDRGTLDGDPDDLLAELAGPVVFRHVLLGQTVTTAQGRSVVDHFLGHHNR